ncbi:MAG: stalk domain-containing protein [Caldisericia bacterium]|nr:stalk domain-containing protein [Caldisericia bacterium]
MRNSLWQNRMTCSFVIVLLLGSLITTSSIKAANVDYLIILHPGLSESVVSEFVTFKENQGFIMQVTSVDSITRSTSGTDNAEKIRNYLKNMQSKQGLKYALLIGDPYDAKNQDEQSTGGAIPMRYTFPLKGKKEYTNKSEDDVYRVPTDLYYADLSGDWDSDRDGFFGEFGEDKANLVPEVFIGRIPFDDESSVQTILDKSMAYEIRAQKTKESALLMATNNSMSETYSDSATLMEAMWNDFLQKNHISRTTFYEKEGVHPSSFETDYSLNKTNVLQQLQKKTVGFSVIVSNGGFMDDLMRRIWKRDSNYNDEPDEEEGEWISILDTNDASELSPENTSVFFLTGYMPNAIDWEDGECIGKELLLTKAAAVLGESRLGYFTIDWKEKYDGGMHSILYYFCNSLTSGKSIGESLYKSFAYTTEHDWYNAFSHGSLYGDPSIGLQEIKSVEVNPPAAPKNLKATKNTSQIVLTWTPSVKGTYSIDGYSIFRGTSSDILSYVTNVSSSVATWTDNNVKAGTRYYYYVKAFDIKKNYSTESNTVSMIIEEEKKDTTPPRIIITNPESGAKTLEESVLITGTITDDDSGVDEARINSTKLTLSKDGSFSHKAPLDIGLNTFKISTSDKAGNEDSVTITVQREKVIPKEDKTPPMIKVFYPKNGESTKEDSMEINGRIWDEGTGIDRATINQKSLKLMSDGTFEYTLLLSNGTNKIIIEAWDKANNYNKEELFMILQQETVIILIIGDKKAMINGFEVPLDVPPSIIKGRTFVPIRFISEAFGAEVEWDAETRTVRIFLEKTNTRVTLQINNTIARINERIVTLDAPPTIIQGRTLVPIRFIAEAFGAQVDWDGVLRKVTIRLTI